MTDSPDGLAIAIAHSLLDETGCESVLLQDLFYLYGRRWFNPDRLALAKQHPRWRGPWRKRQFNDYLVKLRQAGLVKDTPDGRCRIASKRILTGAEYHALCSAHATKVCSAHATQGTKVCSADATKDL